MSKDGEKGFELFGMHFPLYTSLLIKSTMIVWICLLVILFVALTFFQYELTQADIPCGVLSGVLMGYLATLIIKW